MRVARGGILEDEQFEQAVRLCNSVDHAHFVLPAITFLQNERGSLRSYAHPEGHGDSETLSANMMVVRTVALCTLLAKRSRTFSVEHP